MNQVHAAELLLTGIITAAICIGAFRKSIDLGSVFVLATMIGVAGVGLALAAFALLSSLLSFVK